MSADRKDWSGNTRLVHPVSVKVPEGNTPLIRPIYQSVKFTPAENGPAGEQFFYSRISNPTVRQLELTLAEQMKKEDCIVFSSGVAAITGMLLSILKSGDHVISFRELYRPTRIFIKETLTKFNIDHSLLTLKNIRSLESAIIPGRTKLIHFESPTNPNLEAADIEYIISVAKKHNVLVSMDGTFAGIHQHNQFPVDLMVHSLTKSANGHGDVTAGGIAGGSALLKKIRETTIYLGAALDPHSAYMIERGLKTYSLRVQKQAQTAFRVAEYLNNHKKIKAVRYPGLCGPMNHDLLKKQMTDMGSIVTFEISPEVAKSADKFCYHLKLISLAASVGSVESIICPTNTFFGSDLNSQDKEEMGINNFSLRLSVGLEEADDLIADLEQAIRQSQ